VGDKVLILLTEEVCSKMKFPTESPYVIKKVLRESREVVTVKYLISIELSHIMDDKSYRL